MLALISPLRVISAIAVAYAAFCVLLVLLAIRFFPGTDPWASLRIVFSAALVLDLALLLTVNFWWRTLWTKVPALNTALFPDLNGDWRMTIHWSGVNEEGDPVEGIVQATASIKQTFLHMSMEVESEDSDSETLMAKPKRDPESGRPLVYYVYRVVPKKTKAKAGLSYEGAAILKFDRGHSARMTGNYFTSRMRQGHFTLERL